jgi:hypothetical protein
MEGRPKFPPGTQKTVKITALFTDAEANRLTRVAAYYGQPKSVAVHDMVLRCLAEEVHAVDDNALADAEEKQIGWRERYGF